MKKFIVLILILSFVSSFILSGCAGLIGLAATGYGIYRAVKE